MSLFDGMSPDQLRAALNAAQTAYIQLQSGTAVVTLSYTQGDGAKSVGRRLTSPSECARLIVQLKQALGMPTGARLRRLVYL
jgi:hypothetical protein